MSSFKPGKIERVAGPVIVAGDMLGAQMYEVVRVGDQGLIGEIIKIEQDRATVQVYEETAGIRPGEKDSAGGSVPLFMLNTWPVRTARGFKRKLPSNTPLLTGQRIIDFFFPIAKGGTATIPGAFGTGKTMAQQQLAKWADASVIVYVGCGERGNEMAEVLETFPKLVDPRSGEPIMNRTVLIANTSNMPIA